MGVERSVCNEVIVSLVGGLNYWRKNGKAAALKKADAPLWREYMPTRGLPQRLRWREVHNINC